MLCSRPEFASSNNSAGGSGDSDASPSAVPKSDTGKLVAARGDKAAFPA